MKRRGIGMAIAAVFLLGGCGDNLLTGGNAGASAGDNPNPVSCGGDPDHPDTCTYWTCMTVPTQYGNKTHCTAPNPPNGQPPGDYTCPASGGGLYCPGPGAGGSGPWDCTATEFSVDCTRSGGGTTSTGGSGGTTGGTGGATGGSGGSTGGSGGSTGGSGGVTGGGGSGGTGGTGGTGGVPGFSCSYAMVVFLYNGQGPYVIKIGTGGCTDENMTSSDANFNYTCNGVQYDNNGFVMNSNGTVIQPWTGSPSCSSMFNITSTSVTAVDPAVTIIFGVAHRGSFPNHFAEYCGGSPINYQCGP